MYRAPGARAYQSSADEKHNGQRDANWPEWYAAYMAAEYAGAELPK